MAKKTIKLKSYLNIVNEYVAGGVIAPGMLVALQTNGTVIAHNVAGGVCQKMFAFEDELQGKTIDNNFASGEPVQCLIGTPGDEILAWIANGQDVEIGEVLVSNGDGTLKVMPADASTGLDQYPVAIALQDCDMSGSSSVDPIGRIGVRIL